MATVVCTRTHELKLITIRFNVNLRKRNYTDPQIKHNKRGRSLLNNLTGVSRYFLGALPCGGSSFGINWSPCLLVATMASQTNAETQAEARVPAPSQMTLQQVDAAWRHPSEERARLWKRARHDTLSSEATEAAAICVAAARARPCSCWRALSFN